MMEEIICYAVLHMVEALIAWLYFDYLFERKHNLYFTISMFAVGYIFCFFIYEIDRTWVNIISCFIVNLISACWLYDCNIKIGTIHAAFLSFLMTISEIITSLFLGVLGYEFDTYISNLRIMLIMAIISKTMYLGIAMLSARLFKPHKSVSDEPKHMLLFCVLPFMSMIISEIIAYIGLNTEISRLSEIMIIITFMTLLAENLLLFIFYNYIQYTNQQNTMLQISLQKDEADTEYYKALYEQSENQRVLIHDIKKHLNMIETLAEKSNNEEIQDYVAGVVGLSELNNKKNFSENPILNVILQQYYRNCEQAEITFMCDVRADVLQFMNSASITAVFENLLSNAYESALKSAAKSIDVSVIKYEESQSVVITVVNSCDEEPAKNFKGDYKTSKKTSATHGYGIKSVIRVVNKYNGTNRFYYDALEKQFHAVIQFPCEARK